MFNDNLIRRPVNSTAAIVSSQSGCSDSLTAKQRKDQTLDRLNQLKEIHGTLDKKSGEAKAIGVEIFNLCGLMRELNLEVKKRNINNINRLDFHDCFFRTVKSQTTKLQYERLLKLANEMLIENEIACNENT